VVRSDAGDAAAAGNAAVAGGATRTQGGCSPGEGNQARSAPRPRRTARTRRVHQCVPPRFYLKKERKKIYLLDCKFRGIHLRISNKYKSLTRNKFLMKSVTTLK
jgi:hypothetical protein